MSETQILHDRKLDLNTFIKRFQITKRALYFVATIKKLLKQMATQLLKTSDRKKISPPTYSSEKSNDL